ncbi:Exosome complex exonuclease rrp6 [Zancudomyces culisetae]|uniref:Exosome complex exonuclease rrp6 n=1 Tax=Zancudomyces culisetae TaxID=1213189 RepID=A0A1R1PNV8_ZANCU|nr:Exosome complex exonuclease rrp6 [Zancudomyces culisetae]|eukprot:OMH82644.1 Exosome complex exonuclease rrp6 [Zancudomyces culisetae]
MEGMDFKNKQKLKEYLEKGYGKFMKATRRANAIKAGDLEVYGMISDEISEKVEKAKGKVEGMINTLYKGVEKSTSERNEKKKIIETIEDVLIESKSVNDSRDGTGTNKTIRYMNGEGYKKIVEKIENLTDKVEYGIIEGSAGPSGYTRGNKIEQEKGTVGGAGKIVVTKVKEKDTTRVVIHASNIPRPQVEFKDVVDNSATTEWKHKLTTKVNALVPLEESGEKGMDRQHLTEMGIETAAENPYNYEIKAFEPPARVYELVEPIKYKEGMEYGPEDYLYVDSEETLAQMMTELKALEGRDADIAVDLEHHNYRSFLGFTCLMQISSRKKDYIVDTIKLRNELQVLNEIFTDPKIVKVFHGADSDIEWLQRDFGCYVVGLFDTYVASKALPSIHTKYSLSALVDKYVGGGIQLDKRFQLADWRLRPLLPEMINYARSDTHYLLYIYDQIKNDLIIQQNKSKKKENDQDHQLTQDTVLVKYVFNKSKSVSLKTYKKEMYDFHGGTGPNGWRPLVVKYNLLSIFNPLQLQVFKAIHSWRDQIARIEDESTRYVLPNHNLFSISKSLPLQPADLYSLCSTSNAVPPLVRVYANDIISIISDCVSNYNASKDDTDGLLALQQQQNFQHQQQNDYSDRSAILSGTEFLDYHDIVSDSKDTDSSRLLSKKSTLFDDAYIVIPSALPQSLIDQDHANNNSILSDIKKDILLFSTYFTSAAENLEQEENHDNVSNPVETEAVEQIPTELKMETDESEVSGRSDSHLGKKRKQVASSSASANKSLPKSASENVIDLDHEDSDDELYRLENNENNSGKANKADKFIKRKLKSLYNSTMPKKRKQNKGNKGNKNNDSHENNSNRANAGGDKKFFDPYNSLKTRRK